KCISYLKDKKIGIANFIPLNKIKTRPIDDSAKKYAKETGVHGFAIDLVEFDKKYEPAFSHLFGSTLVVDTLDVARRIGIGSVKMVTLDGDVSETSGVMQGGFRERRNRAGFNNQELNDSLKKNQAIVADNESLITRLEKEREDTENKIAKLREFKANLEGDVIKLEKVLHLQSDDTDASKKVRKELEAELAKIEKQANDMSQDISDINFKMADAKTEKLELREKISKIRNPILLAELNTFEEKRSQIREEVIKLEAMLKNFDTQVKTMLSPETEKTFSIIKQHDKEELEFNEQITNLKSAIENSTRVLKEKELLEEKFMKQFKDLFVKRQKIDEDITEHTKKIEETSDKLRKLELEINTTKLEAVRISTELEGLKKEFEQYESVELDTKTPESELKANISRFESALARMDSVNMKALEMYDLVEKEFTSLTEKKGSLVVERQDVLMLINEIETRKIELFMNSFESVNNQFKTTFSQLTTKGADAYLKLENPEDPLSAGIEIKVKLSGNKFMDIRSLSGGEKTMTALAFIFAIQEYEPASFYILDEVDAALDKANAERLAKLVNQYSDRAQYIMISHNDGVIGSAKTLYGVSMDEHGISNVVSLKL
ncbi:MAG TPA: AAA family ATPase, partial [Candidatus Nanoarchaeia archaeon]|nr:AAA family ATPase [Candidatus Nanoarchaeia archaeon]